MTPNKINLDGRAKWLIAATAVPIVATFVLVDPIPQPVSYHDFADDRTLLGIANFWNVISNVLFLVFGLIGLRQVFANDDLALIPRLKMAYGVLFAGIAITALGSGWFHLDPNNDSLFWDRLPMTIAFMPLFTIILGENVSEKLAARLLWPLLLLGCGSVFYWAYTESLGAGDLRPYALVQFLPLILIPTMLLSYRSVFDSTRFYWVAIGLYILAKIFEHFDQVIFDFGEIISGHSLKHIAASLVALILINGIKARKKGPDTVFKARRD